MQEHDLLAVQIVQFAARDMAEDHRRAVPIRSRRVEGPFEHLAVGHRREAVAGRQDRDLVDVRPRQDLQRDARRPRLGDDAGRLGLLVALDAFLGRIAGLAFLVAELDAVNAAVAFVDHHHVVALAVHQRDAGRRERPGPVGKIGQADDVFGKSRGSAKGAADGQHRRKRQAGHLVLHVISSTFVVP
jgi:hypothetical protein